MMTSILVADDDLQIRRFLRNILETSINLHVCGEAVDGLDALARVKELRPDVVILDLSMPRMNGLDAARALRSTNTGLPIILFTLYGNTITTAEVEAAGINAVFSKYDVCGLVKHVEGITPAPPNLAP